MLGVPENGEEFDYGFKLKDNKVSKHLRHYRNYIYLIKYCYRTKMMKLIQAIIHTQRMLI
jgi:hypothetical protein